MTAPIKDAVQSRNFVVNVQNDLGTTHLKQVKFEANEKNSSNKLKVTMKNALKKTGEVEKLSKSLNVEYAHSFTENFRVKVSLFSLNFLKIN